VKDFSRYFSRNDTIPEYFREARSSWKRLLKVNIRQTYCRSFFCSRLCQMWRIFIYFRHRQP